MRVLLTNDDGVTAIGIKILAETVKELGWEAVIVAPYRHMSGASRGRVSNVKLPWKKIERICGFDTYWVDGSPASCVVFGLTNNFLGEFDLCMSGINLGENLGAGLTISGTFGAALEAVSYGKKAIAISRECDRKVSDSNLWDWDSTKESASVVLKTLFQTINEWKLANINIPNHSTKNIIYTSISRESYFEDYYNMEGLEINSKLGFDESKIKINDDIYALRISKAIGITLLEGTIT